MKNQDTNNVLPSMADDAKRLAAIRSDIALQGITTKQTDGSSAPWTWEDVGGAIRDIADMSEKCMIFFIALGSFAKAVRDKTDRLETDKIEIGMPEKQLTPEIRSLFKTWGFEKTKYGYKYYFSPPIKWHIKIPVEIHVYKNHYQFFDNPDQGWFGPDDFKIPNPFEKYWKARYLIK